MLLVSFDLSDDVKSSVDTIVYLAAVYFVSLC